MTVNRPTVEEPRRSPGARAATATAEPDQDTRSPFIEIVGLTKRFGSTTALDHLDLAIPEGEFLVLLGPSGCGKTTTMRCIVGLERAEEGTITVDGRVLFDAERLLNVPPNKRDMGMVFQSYALWPHKSVHGNVAYPLQMKRTARSEIRKRVAESLDLVGLAGFGDRSITTLSGGQMQRVALARSLVMDPKILLLDEPLSNLDAKLRVHLRHELKEIQQRVGVTTIYVTHDQDEALGLADRIIVMRDGRVAQDGAPRDLYRSPRSPFVADFLGMGNQFDANVSAHAPDGAEGLCLATIRGTSVRLIGSDRRIGDNNGASGASGEGDGVVCIRPESVGIEPGHRPTGTDIGNEIPGTVLSRQYQGNRLRYHVAVAGQLDLFAECDADGAQLEAGDACTVALPAAQVLVLSPDGHAPSGEYR